ncbi:MAG: hypothetical protein AVO33_09410 [delta proteobacterium ML8_F1]|nr:MAG: hypothetical protein AVO33_09410 [delta proteobacterium ML8_F1]
METNSQKNSLVDPSALGLFGLTVVTLVASSQKLGFTQGTALIVPWAIFLGAAAQLYAAHVDSKRENLFGTTVFGAFGLFWLGVAASWMIASGAWGEELALGADPKQLGVAFVAYFGFSLVLTLAATKTNKVLLLDFIFIDALFAGLILSTLADSHLGHLLAGYSELLVSIISFYAFSANILNGHFKRIVLPVGKPLNLFKEQPSEKPQPGLSRIA